MNFILEYRMELEPSWVTDLESEEQWTLFKTDFITRRNFPLNNC